MNIFYPEEHKSCGNYISDYNIGFQKHRLPAGERFVPAGRDFNCMIFLISGRATLNYGGTTFGLSRQTLCFVPVAADFSIDADCDLTLVVNYFNKPVDLCEKEALENLSPSVDAGPHNPLLKSNIAVKRFVASIEFYLDAGARCRHFHEIKHKEMLFLLRYFYTKKELAGLFAPVISANLDFRNLVLKNYQQAESVRQLADACHCSVATFNRAFHRDFGEKPLVWLQKQKLKYIVGKLSDINIPLGDIISEFGFSSPGHFTVFCKKHLNATPTEYRKKLTEER
jgi:AraC-like DNA-binding protein